MVALLSRMGCELHRMWDHPSDIRSFHLKAKRGPEIQRPLMSTTPLFSHVGGNPTVSFRQWTRAEAVQETAAFVISNGPLREILFWTTASYYGIQSIYIHILTTQSTLGRFFFLKKICISPDAGGFSALSILCCFIYQKYINPKTCFHQSLDSMNI